MHLFIPALALSLLSVSTSVQAAPVLEPATTFAELTASSHAVGNLLSHPGALMAPLVFLIEDDGLVTRDIHFNPNGSRGLSVGEAGLICRDTSVRFVTMTVTVPTLGMPAGGNNKLVWRGFLTANLDHDDRDAQQAGTAFPYNHGIVQWGLQWAYANGSYGYFPFYSTDGLNYKFPTLPSNLTISPGDKIQFNINALTANSPNVTLGFVKKSQNIKTKFPVQANLPLIRQWASWDMYHALNMSTFSSLSIVPSFAANNSKNHAPL